jgi:hypothetical protein
MPIPLGASKALDLQLLGIRARLIEVAAALDRLDRAERPVEDDPRIDKIRQGLKILADDTSDRVEKIQLLFSLDYEDNWQKDYGLQ